MAKIQKSCNACGGLGYKIKQWVNDGMPLQSGPCLRCSTSSLQGLMNNLEGKKTRRGKIFSGEFSRMEAK